MSDEERTFSTQSPKLLLGTALITALTTLGVSFIGIVPQLRSGDKHELEQLKKDFEDFQRGRAGVPVGTTGSDEARADTKKTLTISGTVRSDDGTRLLTGYDIFLLPEGNNLLAATTDDAGKFTFQGVPSGVYSIVVRDSANGRSGKGLLDSTSDEVHLIGAARVGEAAIEPADLGEDLLGPVAARGPGREGEALGQEHGVARDLLAGIEVLREQRGRHDESVARVREPLAGGAVRQAATSNNFSVGESPSLAIAGGAAFGVDFALDGATHVNFMSGTAMTMPFPDAMT